MKGTPWEPEKARHGGEIKAKLRAWSTGGVDGPRIPDGIDVPRRPYRGRIRKEDVERFDPTPGCPACAKQMAGHPNPGNHKEFCRDRFAKLFADTPELQDIREAERLWKGEKRKRDQVEAQGARKDPRIIEDAEMETMMYLRTLEFRTKT